MENNFVNIDKEVLDETLNDDTLSCINDEKLMKRVMVSSLGECISLLNKIDKSLSVANSLITTAYKKDIEQYFRAVAKNVKKEEKEQADLDKNNIENDKEIN